VGSWRNAKQQVDPRRSSLKLAASASNVRQLRNWHQRTGNGDRAHPLLQEEPGYHGYALLTAEQAATVDESLGPPRTAA
jgi:hypothetical protein